MNNIGKQEYGSAHSDSSLSFFKGYLLSTADTLAPMPMTTIGNANAFPISWIPQLSRDYHDNLIRVVAVAVIVVVTVIVIVARVYQYHHSTRKDSNKFCLARVRNRLKSYFISDTHVRARARTRTHALSRHAMQNHTHLPLPMGKRGGEKTENRKRKMPHQSAPSVMPFLLIPSVHSPTKVYQGIMSPSVVLLEKKVKKRKRKRKIQEKKIDEKRKHMRKRLLFLRKKGQVCKMPASFAFFAQPGKMGERKSKRQR